jgi:hypothetical protein
MFPMTVLKQSGRAVTKDYHLILITTADGRALYINRWGKKTQWGSGWKCEHYGDAGAATADYRKKYREKLGGEYTEHFIHSTKQVKDEAELRKALGHQLIQAIGGPKWAQLIPGADISGLKDGQEEVVWEQQTDGTHRPREKRRKLLEDAPEQPEPIEDRIATNPNWGIWG